MADTTITAEKVHHLRAKTNAAMDICKRALKQANGSVDAAYDLICYNRVQMPTLMSLEASVENLEKRVDLLIETMHKVCKQLDQI